VNMRTLVRAATARERVYEQLAAIGPGKTLIFVNDLVWPTSGLTWAYFAPNPEPDLSDDQLFLRVPGRSDGLIDAWRLWRERFADRRAAVYIARQGRDGLVYPLDPAHPVDIDDLRRQLNE
jgi:hypothetical protein